MQLSRGGSVGAVPGAAAGLTGRSRLAAVGAENSATNREGPPRRDSYGISDAVIGWRRDSQAGRTSVFFGRQQHEPGIA
ncbi:MAG: hypothetical protein ACLFV7_15100, partial [Phycisphaerae bacterium]